MAVKKRKINLKLIFLISSCLVFIISTQIRFDFLGFHFTQLDEIGVAELILFPRDLTTTDSDFLRARIHAQSPILSKILNFCDINGCYEDILKLGNKLYQYFVIPITQTFAPVQFMITRLLISQDQPYQKIMFWGRLPSLLFSCFSLILVILFYQNFRNIDLYYHHLLAISLLGFSLENIIHSLQMISYSIGLFSVLILLILFLKFCRLKEPTKNNMLFLGSVLAMLVYTQYQILFFIPAFFVSLFLWHVKGRFDIKEKIINFLPAVFSFLLLFLPLYLIFIRRHTGAGINYNAGPSGEFVFLLNPNESILVNIKYLFKFFFENNIIVLQTMTSFVPEGSHLYMSIFIFLLFLFTIGMVSFFKAEGVIRQMGLFFIFTWLTWMILVLTGNITLSPTRHSLVLLPLMIITICQGSYFICDLLQNSIKRLKHIHIFTVVVLSFLVITSSLFHFEEFKRERHDRFDEFEIERILQQQAVDSIILFRCVYNLVLMKSINNSYPIFYGCGEYWKANTYTYNYKISGSRIAFVGMGGDMSENNFESLTTSSNELVGMKIFKNVFEDHKLIYSKIKPSGSQMEFSKKVNSQTNGFSMFVYERINES